MNLVRHLAGLPLLDALHWIVLSVLVDGVLSLRLITLDVPRTASSGDSIGLSCVYDLQGDGLYSVKWYRDDMEFFRFVPSDRPPGQFFSIPGVKVDLERSFNGTVHIQEVDPSTSGAYRCEVSAEAPSFQTVQAEKIMIVHDARDSNAAVHCSWRWITLFLSALSSTLAAL